MLTLNLPRFDTNHSSPKRFWGEAVSLSVSIIFLRYKRYFIRFVHAGFRGSTTKD